MERHSTDYSRFDAIDADASPASPYDGGFKADLTWHNSRTTSFVLAIFFFADRGRRGVSWARSQDFVWPPED